MKNKLSILFLFMLIISCEMKKVADNVANDFDIAVKIDTFKISPKGSLCEVVFFRNNFYTIFESQRKNTSQSFKKMMVFNQKGKFIEDVSVPYEIQDMPHYQISVENDSLYVKESQFEENNFLLGEYVADLKLVPRKNFKIYQDEKYNVYKNCNGEFGGTIYFQDIKTNEVYEANSSCPTVINKVGNKYYVTDGDSDFGSISEISDPTKMQKSKFNFDKRQGSEFAKGVKVLIETDYDLNLSTSFVVNDKLLTIYSDKKTTFIGEIQNGKMKPVFNFGYRFYCRFKQQLKDGKQIMSCYLLDSKKDAIMIVDKNKIDLHIIQ